MEVEDADDDRPDPHTVALSQRLWEYKTLVSGNEASEQFILSSDTNSAGAIKKSSRVAEVVGSTPKPKIPCLDSSLVAPRCDLEDHEARGSSKHRSGDIEREENACSAMARSSESKSSRSRSPLQYKGGQVEKHSRWSRTEAELPTTSLEGLRSASETQRDHPSKTWDILVLVLQASGLQQVATKTGCDADLGTLLVADPSLSFFRLTLWREAARSGARLIRAGDIIRITRVSVRKFRGSVQASSTRRTCFRVVWRDDTFISPHEMESTSMLCGDFLSKKRRRLEAGSVRSQGNGLAIARKFACDLAAWAKREFPSVTCANSVAGRGASFARAGTLAGVRKGVCTAVQACVLRVSSAESLWSWEGVGGMRRKNLVSRATALLTDGLGQEMILQLWGNSASEESINTLRARIITGCGSGVSSPRKGAIARPTVFHFDRLRPDFSFSCEALVLNTTTGGTIRELPSDCHDARRVADAVVAAAETLRAPSTWLDRGDDRVDALVDAADENYSHGISTADRRPIPARHFVSVADVLSAGEFPGMGYLRGVVIKRVEAPGLETPMPSSSGSGDVSCIEASRHGVPQIRIHLCDPSASDAQAEYAAAQAVLNATVDGGMLCDVLGGIPEALLFHRCNHGEGTTGGLRALATNIARRLVEGLKVGGDEGERVDVNVVCKASIDANGRAIPGGSGFRLISLKPSNFLQSIL